MSAVETWQLANTAPEKIFNDSMTALKGALLFAEKPAARVPGSTAFGVGGGMYGGTAVADATFSGTDDTTNYVVAHRTTGVLTMSTATTQWDDTATYGRVGRAVFASGALTYTDWRWLAGGIFFAASPPPSTGGTSSNVTALSIASGVVTVDLSAGDYFTLALTANVTGWTFTNPPGTGKGCTKWVRITQGSGPFTCALPFRWAGGTAVAVSTTAGAVDHLAITSLDNAATFHATLAKDSKVP